MKQQKTELMKMASRSARLGLTLRDCIMDAPYEIEDLNGLSEYWRTIEEDMARFEDPTKKGVRSYSAVEVVPSFAGAARLEVKDDKELLEVIKQRMLQAKSVVEVLVESGIVTKKEVDHALGFVSDVTHSYLSASPRQESILHIGNPRLRFSR